MLKHRIIPVLLWDGDQVVQSVQFKRPHRKCGSMQQHIRVMETRNIDEIIILDVDATPVGREPLFDKIKEYASQLFCPVTYGGGITKLEHVDKLIKECGIDKVSINNYYYLISKVANKYGSQAIVASVDHAFGNPQYEIYNIPLTIEGACRQFEQMGAGEVLLTDMDCNGRMKGYHTGLIHAINRNVKIPIVANGGCGKPEHMISAIENGANAVAASSMFLFTEHTPRSCARALQEAGVPVRLDG